jgi:hypothetical protein
MITNEKDDDEERILGLFGRWSRLFFFDKTRSKTNVPLLIILRKGKGRKEGQTSRHDVIHVSFLQKKHATMTTI